MKTSIPLILKLKRENHKNIAKAQDIIVEELYKVFDKAVLHGGTAIWRCYNGNRFSEDIDAYIAKDEKKLDILFETLKKKGFIVLKKKIGENSLYSTLQLERTIVRLEALFKKAEGSLAEYETADGNLITIYSLLPEELIKEKVSTYLKRKKIRDLYDIFFLLRCADNAKVKKEIENLLENFEMPEDTKELKVLIMQGIVPDVDKMLDYIKRCCDGQNKI